jgi:hypothetical protein
MKKWACGLNRQFSKEKVHMGNKYLKKCSTAPAIKEMQIKNSLRFHLTPVSVVISRTQTTTDAGDHVVKQEPLYTVHGNVN